MKKVNKDLILIDCNIMLKKFGDIPFITLHQSGRLQQELWEIGSKYGISGIAVFTILMENFPRKENE